MLFKLMGFYVQVERHTSKGRMDVTIQTRDYVYINDSRQLFKIGVCFSSEERGIGEWKVEK